MVLTTDIEAIEVFSQYQDCHPDSLSVSVYAGSIIYVLTLADCWRAKNVPFNMCFIEVNQNPRFMITWKNG